MDQDVPWAELVTLIEPYSKEAGCRGQGLHKEQGITCSMSRACEV